MTSGRPRRLEGFSLRQPRLIIALTTAAYLTAVMQRSSLGVAGVDAAHRFGIDAAALSTLAVGQLAVYALLQVPVGMLLDRFGPSRLIATGAILMSLGQVVVACSQDLGIAVLGRMLVGAGDATTYVSGLRLVAAWQEPKKIPLTNQWYGNIGQLGQVMSAIPFAQLLHLAGWLPAFASLAGCSVVVSVAVWIAMADAPGARRFGHRIPLREVLRKSRAALARPGTHLGFFTHFTLQFPATVVGLLWGFPLMVEGLHYPRELAASLLPLLILTGLVTGPLVGAYVSRHERQRSTVVLMLAAVTVVAWLVLLGWPGEPPLALLVAVLIITGGATPASNLAFDFARTFNPRSSLGSASGIVNVGGFTASFTVMFLIGLLLDLHAQGGPREWDDYRVAFLALPALVCVGSLGVWLTRRTTRRHVAENSTETGTLILPEH